MALEYEISSWRGFKEALNSQDREVFERLMDAARNNCMAASNACRPVVLEAMVMSILLSQQKQLSKLEKKPNSSGKEDLTRACQQNQS
jgi:hypothetical protein